MKYFAYCRRSQDDEGRQILSIPAQRDEVDRLLEKHEDMELAAIFEESRTAKSPGRPVFNEMMGRIERGEAEGIIAWHPDRLARNSIDGGLLIYHLDRGILKDLKFSTYTFENSSQGKFMLQIMFGYSKYYVDSLSENVKRGNRRKIEQGVLPNRPPIGYKNDRETNSIIPDPATFATIRRIWDFALSGSYSIRALRRIAADEWGFRTPMRKRSGGKALATGTIYDLLSNRFYTGAIPWRGQIYPGKHLPMVTREEFDRMQDILGRPGRPASQKHVFPYTGLIRCGTCGCAVTAERQVNRYGYSYEYYHCTKKRRDVVCHERYIERRDLDRQLLAYLRQYEIPDEVHSWLLTEAAKVAESDADRQKEQIDSLRAALAEVERNTATLTDLRVRQLIDDNEFISRRDTLRADADRLRSQITLRNSNSESWLEPFQTLISFSNLAVFWFEHGDSVQKRLILTSLGSNLTLSNKILRIQATEPLGRLPKRADCLRLCAVVDDIRTSLADSRFEKQLDSMRKLAAQFKPAANDNEIRKAA